MLLLRSGTVELYYQAHGLPFFALAAVVGLVAPARVDGGGTRKPTIVCPSFDALGAYQSSSSSVIGPAFANGVALGAAATGAGAAATKS